MSQTERVGGHVFHFVERGTGSPVLLLHGVGTSTHIFAEVMEALPRRRVLAVDLPASGKSESWAKHEPAALADELFAFLGRKKARPAVIVGHSFGGVVALELAARHPAAVKGLVVLCAPAVGVGNLSRMVKDPAAELLFKWAEKLPVPLPLVKAYLSFLFGDSKAIRPEHVAGAKEAMSAKGYYAGVLAALRAIAVYRLSVDDFADRKYPVRVLWGEKDPLVPVAQGEQVARALGAELEVISGAGHCLPEERPDVVLRAIAAVSRTSRTKAG